MNADLLKKALINGVKNLVNNQSKINDCNYFPVPDKDTGTNMSMTVMNAYSYLNEYDGNDCKVVLELFSKGAFFGARGNSGIILSQIFHGLYKSLPENCEEITPKLFYKILSYAIKYGKKSVLKVAKFSIISAFENAFKNFKQIKIKKNLKDIKALAKAFLNLLNQELLNTAKVYPDSNNQKALDSGTLGFYKFWEGFYFKLINREAEFENGNIFSNESKQPLENVVNLSRINYDVDHGYCCEVLISHNEETKKINDLKLKTKIYTVFEKLGMDSICVVNTNSLIKLHAHSSSPDMFLKEAIKYGDLLKIKIENMNYQPETHSFFTSSEINASQKDSKIQKVENPVLFQTDDFEINQKEIENPVLYVFIDNEPVYKWIDELGYKNITIFKLSNNNLKDENFYDQINQKLTSEKSQKIIVLTTIPKVDNFLKSNKEKYQKSNFQIFLIKSAIVLYFLASYWNSDWNFEDNIKEIEDLIKNLDYSYIIKDDKSKKDNLRKDQKAFNYLLMNNANNTISKSPDILTLFVNQLQTIKQTDAEILTILVDNKFKTIKNQILDVLKTKKHKLSEIKLSFCKLYNSKLIEFCFE